MNEIEGGARTLNAFTTPWFQVTIYQILRPLYLIIDNTILPCKLSHFLAIYLQISPENLR